MKETINQRVRAVRKALDMTQQEFADKLKFKTGNTFSMIEREESVVTEQNILLICNPNQLQEGKTVNEDWLRTGKGEMFIDTADPARYDDLKPDERELMTTYDKLYNEAKQNVREYAHEKLELQELKEKTGDREKREQISIAKQAV